MFFGLVRRFYQLQGGLLLVLMMD